ncbi:flagellin [Pseudoalteromonas carrageenovora]|uniref:flagellin n=1 Tax=Pseudoalteromonas carrageenovora TaxID=227 RepID=UPI003A0FE7B1
MENGALSVSNNNGADITFEGLTDSNGTPTVALDVTPEGYDGAAGTAVTINDAAGATRISGAVQLNSSETFSVDASDASLAAGTDPVTSKLNDVSDLNITSQKGSQDALAIIDNAIANIDSQRASLGAVQNRFDHTISNLSNISENVSASRSRIQDTDFATETAEMTKNQILQQAGTSILSQANQLPQTALSLLG